MFRNYLKVSLRNLIKFKGYSLINIIGLAIGMTCSVLILLFVQDEISFDKFHTKSELIYRLNKEVTPKTSGVEWHAITPGLMGPTMVADFPEVEKSLRLLPWFSDVLMTWGESSLKVSDVVIADSNFFDIFDFRLIRGDVNTALVEPQSIVLSENTAQKFFGNVDPIGQVIVGLNSLTYKITGIIEDTPANSTLKYNALISWASTVPGVGALNFAWLNRWTTQVNYTFFQLAPGSEVSNLELKFSEFMDKYMPRQAEHYKLYLQPFNEMYLHSSHIRFSRGLRSSNITTVYIFSAIALLTLLIACVNFTNLSTAKATKRAREVGVRKVLGAERRQLARQFLGESMLLSFLAAFNAVTFVEVLLPYFNSFTGKTLDFDVMGNWSLFWIVICIPILVGIISGLYPSLLLSAFKPLSVLSGNTPILPSLRSKIKTSIKSTTFRSGLVVFQFSISIILIAGTFIIYQQMQFMQTKNLGFDKDQIIVLPIGNTDISEQYPAFKNELLQHSNITHVTGSNSVPGLGMMSFGLHPEGKQKDEQWSAYSIRVDDYDFLETYGLEIAAGRYFSKEFTTDESNAVIINEALARSLGWEDPVGKSMDIKGELEGGVVIGVIKDFHTRSLHYTVEPLLFYFAPRYENVSVRIAGENIPETIQFLQDKWQAFDSSYPFEYYFLDQRFAQFYDSEQRLMQIFGIFSMLAIFIACLGLLGLAAYTAEQRTKEIGVRKVLGATVTSIITLLSKQFSRLVLFAFLIASPVAYYLLNRWLQDFAFRININFWTILFAGAFALILALLTISYQAIKAGLTDPVKSLRYE